MTQPINLTDEQREFRSVVRRFAEDKIAPRAAATDERAEEFTGTLVFHRVGSSEPVESVSVRIKRSILVELHDSLGRLLTRSRGFHAG